MVRLALQLDEIELQRPSACRAQKALLVPRPRARRYDLPTANRPAATMALVHAAGDEGFDAVSVKSRVDGAVPRDAYTAWHPQDQSTCVRGRLGDGRSGACVHAGVCVCARVRVRVRARARACAGKSTRACVCATAASLLRGRACVAMAGATAGGSRSPHGSRSHRRGPCSRR